jgi:hypothetical protein
MGYLCALAKLGLGAIGLDRRAAASRLYELLRPYSGYCAINGFSICIGSVSQYLGELARYLGMQDQAVTHYEEALETNSRLGYKAQAEQTRRALLEARRARRKGAGTASSSA